MNVLITSGGTEEAIDGVRCITNSSTGRTGAAIAGYFSEHGSDVLLLRAEKAAGAPQGVTERRYRSYADLAATLKEILGAEKWDAVIHLAAVSDYTVAAVEVDGIPFSPGGPGKIAGGRDVKITLKPTAKILDSLRSWSSNPGLVVVGFKLTDGASREEQDAAVADIFHRNAADYVVHNDLADMNEKRHPATLRNPGGILKQAETNEGIAAALYERLTLRR